VIALGPFRYFKDRSVAATLERTDPIGAVSPCVLSTRQVEPVGHDDCASLDRRYRHGEDEERPHTADQPDSHSRHARLENSAR
jgi:hypothetical protein